MQLNTFDIDDLVIISETGSATDYALDIASGSYQETMPMASYTGCTPGTGKKTPC